MSAWNRAGQAHRHPPDGYLPPIHHSPSPNHHQLGPRKPVCFHTVSIPLLISERACWRQDSAKPNRLRAQTLASCRPAIVAAAANQRTWHARGEDLRHRIWFLPARAHASRRSNLPIAGTDPDGGPPQRREERRVFWPTISASFPSLWCHRVFLLVAAWPRWVHWCPFVLWKRVRSGNCWLKVYRFFTISIPFSFRRGLAGARTQPNRTGYGWKVEWRQGQSLGQRPEVRQDRGRFPDHSDCLSFVGRTPSHA